MRLIQFINLHVTSIEHVRVYTLCMVYTMEKEVWKREIKLVSLHYKSQTSLSRPVLSEFNRVVNQSPSNWKLF